MAIVREIEPWDALLAAGRADERLVRQAMQHERFPQQVELPAALHPDVAGRAAPARDRASSGATRPRRSSRRGSGRRSRRRAPRRASRSASSCRRSRSCRATRGRGRCSCIRPRRWRRTRRARCTRSGCRAMRAAIYDGDTPREQRADLRRQANVVLTNPDMLHVGILPNHSAWARLLPQPRGRGRRRGARLPRRSSARTWPTCCGGCGGSASCTGRRRGSCSPRRRSPTRASWRRG